MARGKKRAYVAVYSDLEWAWFDWSDRKTRALVGKYRRTVKWQLALGRFSGHPWTPWLSTLVVGIGASFAWHAGYRLATFLGVVGAIALYMLLSPIWRWLYSRQFQIRDKLVGLKADGKIFDGHWRDQLEKEIAKLIGEPWGSQVFSLLPRSACQPIREFALWIYPGRVFPDREVRLQEYAATIAQLYKAAQK